MEKKIRGELLLSFRAKSLNSRTSPQVSSLYFIWYKKKESTKCPADSGERGYRADTSCTVETDRQRCIVRDRGDGATRENTSTIFHGSSPNWEIASSHRWTIVVPRNPQFSIPPSHFRSFYSSWARLEGARRVKASKQIRVIAESDIIENSEDLENSDLKDSFQTWYKNCESEFSGYFEGKNYELAYTYSVNL